MKIVPIRIKFKALYENRHLFTDDFKYNSLIVSNAINTNVNIINIECYNTLDIGIKYIIYASNKYDYNFILDKDGLYILSGIFYRSADCFIDWKDCDINKKYDILTIVNEK